MRTPPLLLGASLLFWGWQTGIWYAAVAMAFVLEGSRLVKSRFDFSPSDLHRISDLCTLLFLGVFIYLYASNGSAKALLALLRWLPVILAPLIIAQVYSTSEGIEIGALFLVIRRKRRKQGGRQSAVVDLSYPYFALCLLCASVANAKNLWFYAGVFLLSAWALWSVRSRRYSPILWMTLLVWIGFAGYLGHKGLHNLQAIVEQKTVDWLSRVRGADVDPYRSRTAIGDVGTLKLSNRILFRVDTGSADTHPILLREASYNAYHSSMWFAAHSRFRLIEPEVNGSTWKLATGLDKGNVITIAAPLKNGKGMLKLPTGTFEIAELPVMKMVRNQFGALKVEEGPGLLTYKALFNSHTSMDSPPNEADLALPQGELDVLNTIVGELELTSKPPKEILKTLAAFFREHYTYSLDLHDGAYKATPLGDFLLRTRSGHCEYFATATVLLLRAAGVPARYATGYSVQEFSKLETRFVVRARHAHSWALVHVNNAWHDFDTTPASWNTIEGETESMLRPLHDLCSWCLFKLSTWRWRQRGGDMAKYVAWLLVPLILLLAKRLYSRARIRRPEGERQVEETGALKRGADSEFYLIEKRLMELGHTRHPWETLSAWLKRIGPSCSSVPTGLLPSILALHYRYRFDPKGITSEERRALTANAHSWLDSWY